MVLEIPYNMNTTVADVISVDKFNYQTTIHNHTLENNITIICDDFLSKESVLSSVWFQMTIYFLYMIIFFAALIGNGLVCYVVLSIPRMKTVTNYFIVNLAVGDILMDLFCVPTSFISTLILQYWPFGAKLCPIVNYSQAVSVLVSAYTLVAISVDRYVAIMWPLRPRMTKTHAKLSIVGVWSVALTISLPIAVVSRLDQPHEQYVKCDQYVCQEVWPSTEHRYYYSIAMLVFQYLIPFTVLLFTYVSIGFVVWGKRPPGEAENSRDRRLARSKRKTITMMLTVIIAFTSCWLPFNILMLMVDNGAQIVNWEGLPFLWTLLHWLSMSHCCYNPVIYCWMNARFRSGFLVVLSRIPGFRCVHSDSGGFTLAGHEVQNNSILQRTNTCTTWISMRHNTNNQRIPQRSSSLRCRNDPAVQHRHFKCSKSSAEDEI